MVYLARILLECGDTFLSLGIGLSFDLRGVFIFQVLGKSPRWAPGCPSILSGLWFPLFFSQVWGGVGRDLSYHPLKFKLDFHASALLVCFRVPLYSSDESF